MYYTIDQRLRFVARLLEVDQRSHAVVEHVEQDMVVADATRESERLVRALHRLGW